MAAAAAERPTRLTGWALLARDAEMLRAADAGMTGREIARKFGVSRQHVEKRLAAARKANRPPEPEAVARFATDDPPWVLWIAPLFPVNAFTPQSICAHKGEIKPGSYLYCPICHKSGVDHRAALRRDPRTDPKPEPRPSAAAAPQASATTRRARRAARRAAETA